MTLLYFDGYRVLVAPTEFKFPLPFMRLAPIHESEPLPAPNQLFPHTSLFLPTGQAFVWQIDMLFRPSFSPGRIFDLLMSHGDVAAMHTRYDDVDKAVALVQFYIPRDDAQVSAIMRRADHHLEAGEHFWPQVLRTPQTLSSVSLC